MSTVTKSFEARNVQEIIDRIEEKEYPHTGGVSDTIGSFAETVVEEGTFKPDVTVTAELSLTPKERITGKRNQDVTDMLIFGMVLGAALERDVPKDTVIEDAWRDGNFEMPE